MSGLIFPFTDVIREFEIFKQMARQYIDSKSIKYIEQAQQDLQTFQSSSETKPIKWSIPPDSTVWSKQSEGHASPGQKNAYRLRAGLSFVWEIGIVAGAGWGKREHFSLDGLASILIRLEGCKMSSNEAPSELAAWRIEVGDARSPGVHFHIQIKESELAGAPFPKGLDIPRLPTMPMTPMLAFESVIADIFQDSWKSRAAQDDKHTQSWGNIQRPRLERFFDWQKRKIQGTGSPWVLLKRAHPEADLLTVKRT